MKPTIDPAKSLRLSRLIRGAFAGSGAALRRAQAVHECVALEPRLALSGDPFVHELPDDPGVDFVVNPPVIELITHGAAFARGQTVEFTTDLTGFHQSALLRYYLDNGDGVFNVETDNLVGAVAANAAQVQFEYALPADTSVTETFFHFVAVSDEGNAGPAVTSSFFIHDRTVSLDVTDTSFDSASSPGTFRVSVRYTVDGDVSNFDQASFGSGDLLLTLADGRSLQSTFDQMTVDAPGRALVVTYMFVAEGGFDHLDNGPARLRLVADQALLANPLDALGSQPLTTFNLFFENPVVSATAVSTSASTLGATVRYSDNNAISWDSLAGGDAELRGPGGLVIPATLGSRSGSSTSVLVSYAFAAPGGLWDSTDNGAYELWVRPLQVWDNLGFPVASARVATYNLFFNNPTAARESESVVEGGAFMDVTVRYTDAAGSPAGISYNSVSDGDVELVGPSGFYAQGTLVSRTLPSAGVLLATYRFVARNGAWDQSDNGAYTLAMRPNQVFDNQGFLVAPAVLRTYNLFFTSPSVSLTSTNVANGSADLVVAVTYQALSGGLMSWDSLGDGDDLSLTGPNGFAATSLLVSRAYNATNNTYTVTYRFAAPGGTWDSSDNGAYQVRVRPGEALDGQGRPVPASLIASYSLFF